MSASDRPALLQPDWPAPAHVRALMTTRQGGVSQVPFTSLNLGDHVGDNPQDVAANRAIVRSWLPGDPKWLTQVHGTVVSESGTCQADASVSRVVNDVSVIMTADCLPVLFCDQTGTVVAAAHAGWRGLCDGVLERTIEAMAVDPAQIMAWLGAAIGPQQFEVGDEVRTAFLANDARADKAFVPGTLAGKWLADIYVLARQRLAAAGVTAVYGGGLCTVTDPERFFSYRRDKQTGRMAALIWME